MDDTSFSEDLFKHMVSKGFDVGFNYELTLTTDQFDPLEIIQCINQLPKFPRMKYCWELTKEGRPHVHMHILSATELKDSDINYSKRFTLKKVRNLKKYEKYILKDIENEEAKKVFAQWGIYDLFISKSYF